MTGTSPSPRLMILLQNISKSFGRVTALDGVSFEIHPGEIHALCGENGAGKSTLMNILGGVWPYGSYSGKILERPRDAGKPDVELQFRTVHDATCARIALVHQELAIVPDMTVIDNLFLGNETAIAGVLTHARQRSVAKRHFAELKMPAPLDRPAGELGIGFQQKLEIARALLTNPEVLVLDEPTSALSADEAEALIEWIRDLARRGTACVYISHRMDEVFALADRITVLRDGRSIWTKHADETNSDEVIEAMVDRPASDVYAHTPLPAGDPVLDVRELRVSRDGRKVLCADDLVVREGEIVGLAGMMGAGRTCLLRCLAGALNDVHVAGSFRLPNDSEAGTAPGHPREALVRGLFLMPEDRKTEALFMEENLETNITAASFEHYVNRGSVDRTRMQSTCAEHMKHYGVKAQGPDDMVASLSGGNQQKILFCRAAEVAPRLLLLDEPTRGIDIGAKDAIYRQMERWTRDGWSILWSSSELPELLGISDRIYVLANGRITAEFANRPFRDADIMAKAAVA